MPARPFTAMAESIDPDIREYALGIGGISLLWAYQEVGLDILIALLGHLSGHQRRHPVPTKAKLEFLLTELKKDRPYLRAYREELIQIHVLTESAAERRNLVTHGAVISRLDGPRATLWKYTREDDDLREHSTSPVEMLLTFQLIFELAAHTWNMIIRIVRDHIPEAAEQTSTLPLLDVSGFQWPSKVGDLKNPVTGD